MSPIALRTVLLFVATSILLTPNASLGRGPGGGGPGAGRGAGGRGDNNRELTKPEFKKKDGARIGGQNGPAPGGLNKKFGGAQQLQSNPQTPGGKFENGTFNPANIQPINQRPGNQNANWKARDGQPRQTTQNAINDFQDGSQPFSAQWYADHPAAWQFANPHADAWAAATATGVAAWLGWNAANDSGYGTSYSATYVYEQPAEEAEYATDDDSSDEVLANNSNTAQDDPDEWLALGVYAVQSTNGEPTSRYLQLAVNRQGELRGVYYDEISGSSQNLSGQVDPSTQVATWSLDANQETTFSAPLGELTQDTGTIEVTQRSGKQQWRIARQQNAS